MRCVALLLLTLAACPGSPTPGEELSRSLLAFHEHLRWKRFDKAAAFIKPVDKKKFMALYTPAEDTLQIDEIDVQNIEWVSVTKAKVLVSVRFFNLPSVTLEKKKWDQRWQNDDGTWWIVSDVSQPFFSGASSQPASQPWN